MRGQALVEFAIVTPILLLIVLGGADVVRWGTTAWSAEGAARVIADATAQQPTADLSTYIAGETPDGCTATTALLTTGVIVTARAVVTCPFAGLSPFFGTTIIATADAVVSP